MVNQKNLDNKRIAKNTLFLYIRMFLIMAVTLYTSRVVLDVLGIEDFGIYNVVGGVVSMFAVLQGAMAVATQRFLNFELGRGDTDSLKNTFSMSLTIYGLFAIIFILVAETLGLWFLNTYMTIPENRIVAANWVFQFSVITCVNALLTAVYNASIIAHEKMSIFAYISILEVLLKLLVVFGITICSFDKLIAYSFFYLLVNIVITLLYRFYCLRNFEECQYKFSWDKILFVKLISYSGWNIFGSLCTVAKGQGLNVLLNIFFSPSVNAARAVAYQVNTAVSQFFNNFYIAVQPQIIKYYSRNEMDNMLKLVFRSSKLSFFLILFISLPIAVDTSYIIRLWLGQLPEYVVPFTRLIILITAIDAMSNPIMTTAQATGHIKLYQALIGVMTMLIVPISYIFLRNGSSPIVVFYVSVVIVFINLFLRLWIVKRLMRFPARKYIKEVLIRSGIVALLSFILPILIRNSFKANFMNFIILCCVCVLSGIVIIYTVGLNKEERKFIVETIRTKFFDDIISRKR